MALRDIRANKSTSALIFSLIALPLMVLVLVVTLIDSSVPTPEENATRQLGKFDLQLIGHDYPVGSVQDPNEPGRSASREDLSDDSASSGIADIPTILKALDSGASSSIITSGYVEIQGSGGTVRTDLTVGEVSDPRFAGRYILESGDWGGPDSVLINHDLSQATGLGVGDTLRLGDSDYPVSGIMKNSSGMGLRLSGLFQSLGLTSYGSPVLFVAPGHPAAQDLEVDYSSVFVEGMTIDLDRQAAFNAMGIGSYVRSFIIDPPASEMWAGSTSDEAKAELLVRFLSIFIIGFFIFLEVGLLSGAAFAVGAKKQRRSFALLSANGAEAKTIQWIGAYSGLFLGGMAVLAGSAFGLLGAWGITVWSELNAGGFPGWHVPWLAIASLMLLGLASAVVAALIPARRVGRNAALNALRAEGHSAAGPKGPVFGYVLLGLGLACWATALYLGISATTYGLLNDRTTLIVGGFVAGIVLCTVGLMLTIGRILWAIGGLGHRFPLASRLALRDIQRNRSRTVPAIAAVIAGTALATSLALAIGYSTANGGYQVSTKSSSIYDLYLMSGNEDGAPLNRQAADQHASDVLAQMERSGYPAQASGQYGQFIAGYRKAADEDQWPVADSWVALLAPASACRYGQDDIYSKTNPSLAVLEARDDSLARNVRDGDRFTARHCGIYGEPRGAWDQSEINAQITDVAGLKLMLGKHYTPALGAAFERGQAIVTVPEFVTDQQRISFGMPDLDFPLIKNNEYFGGNTGVLLGVPLKRSFELDAVEVLTGDRQMPPIMVSEAAMNGTGGIIADSRLLVDLGRVLNADEVMALNKDLAALDVRMNGATKSTGVETLLTNLPWVLSIGAGALVLTTAAMTTGLALADGRRDARVMVGVGAEPRTRRRFGAVQAGLTALLGTTLGIVLGAMPVSLLIIIMEGSMDPRLLLPVVALLAIPPAAALIGWALVPRTVPADRMAG
ncbi:hypothetical protein CQ018_02875 [Arthrobacter sp. MYb227]|uniref:FtsX-like permease family protein n=1 Tax=Arthrobacter sp. MYb227 TaxID=1848601 RepID=UPI000CFCBE40|nr:FtsX-like permease family protein [Arthrobacter sp. MYb227]PQZ96236.1 hypothetical protein CQ018_02875 [Arthrobacter sp. MYb227]